jgi:CRP-like cAMP-binding protein
MAEYDFQRRLSVLQGNEWFRDLPLPALNALARSCRHRRYLNGELIAARGVPPEGLAIVLRGAIRSATLSSDGHEVVFSLIQPGFVWGLVAAIDGLGAVHDTRAHRRTEILLIPRRAFLEILDGQPALYAHFARLLCYRLRKAYSAVDEFALVPLRQRLARQLCSLALASAGTRAHSEDASLRLTQAEIAEMLSAARPSVNRELKRMQDEGLVALGYRGLTVKQFARLRDLCEHQGLFTS